MRSICLLLGLSLFIAAPASAADKTAKATALAEKAGDKIRKGDLTGAGKLVERALKMDPDNPAVLLRRGALKMAAGTALASEAGTDVEQLTMLLQGAADLSRVIEIAPGTVWAERAASIMGYGQMEGGDELVGELENLFNIPDDETAAAQFDGPPGEPSEFRGLSATEAAAVIAAFPAPASTPWDNHVRPVILGIADSDESGWVDSEEELGKVPCEVFTALDAAVQRQGGTPIMSLYGFHMDYIWVGYTLGFEEGIRPQLVERAYGCGLVE